MSVPCTKPGSFRSPLVFPGKRELPPRDVYKFNDSFDKKTIFIEFSRGMLKLKECEINTVLDDYRDSREQKYQIIMLWKNKTGRVATIAQLHDLKREFDEGNDGDNQESGSESSFRDSGTPSNLSSNPMFDSSRQEVVEVNIHLNEASEMTYRDRNRVPAQTRTEDYYTEDLPRPGMPTVPIHLQRHNNNRPMQQQPPQTLPPQTSSIPADDRAFNSAAKALKFGITEVQVEPTSGATDVLNEKFRNQTLNDVTDSRSSDFTFCDEINILDVEKCSEDDIARILVKDDVYEIKNKPKGYVLIINNNFEGTKGKRTGAKIDVANMQELWRGLDCKVTVEEDCTAEEIDQLLDKVAKSKTICNYDFFVLFVMSHGGIANGHEYFKGSDGKGLQVDYILEKFDNTRSRNLIGKPKLFFFQFCRGKNVDEGFSTSEHQSIAALNCGHDFEPVYGDHDHTIHTARSDILISYPTQSGDKAYRGEDGSWFINAIANVYARYAKEEHVIELMTRVRNAVMAKTGRTNHKNANIRCKEMSESRDMLSKRLYLMPGYPEDDLP